MPARRESCTGFVSYVSLDLQYAAIMKDSRAVERFLKTYAEIDDVGQKVLSLLKIRFARICDAVHRPWAAQ